MLSLYFMLMEIGTLLAILTLIAMPIVIAMIADAKGRSALAAFLLSLVLPIPVLIYYWAVPARPHKVIKGALAEPLYA